MRKDVYQWAREYCGDPNSHFDRGLKIRELLIHEGLTTNHRVLDVGCGALSQGKPLIEYLNSGNYTGLDPNGWLIEAALQAHSNLLDKSPNFQYKSDFTATSGPFDYIVAHSVFSHIAQWQLEQALSNIRKAVDPGARWYASLRISSVDQYPRYWAYPGNSFFRFRTVQVLGWHSGWVVEQLPDWKRELVEVAPNDIHDWVRLTAVPTPESMNALRLDEDVDRTRDAGIMENAKKLYEQQEAERLKKLEEEMAEEEEEEEDV